MTFLMPRAKLALAAWLETHTDFRLSTHAENLPSALDKLDNYPLENSYAAQFGQLIRHFHRAVLILLVVSFVLGFLAVPSAFATSESNQVNIFWLLIVMLGFHCLNLLIWSITLVATMKRRPAGQGFLLNSLLFLNKKIAKHTNIDHHVSDAFLQWQCPSHSNTWLVSGVSHTAWCGYLFAGWLMTLLLLLTNQVDFVWETTLLSDQAFLQLTQSLSVVPQWFGLALPNKLDVLASRVDLVSQSASTRQHWANFLLASIFLYGVLPRLFLAIVCGLIYRWRRATLPLTTAERIIQSRYQQKETQTRHIIDEQTQPHLTVSLTDSTHQQGAIFPAALSGDWKLFEWSDAAPVELSQVSSVATLNSRDEQAQFLGSSSPSPVYVLVNGAQSPDRGTRRFFTAASKSYPALMLVVADAESAAFMEDWQRLANEAQVTFSPLLIKE
ncbi:DUF2868 domain-containing protein [Marinomonas sp. A79]|uniref:DUF2868 domain-containing protein n=1 Tax=Marinomonas vulgaris TaxID=2823372 RepID=A0ABS5HB54_9GAMM|nr:DUF2868 domain-containing protein [Marinomonas vulgaris]MBR7888886.1 DUF2868 domain-containing protein [Marinomonas vulgaris]